jgi:tRNA-dihydrouridine synthase
LDGDLVFKSRIAKLVDSGIDFLTIHGGTLKENKVTVGPCHLDKIRLAIDTARAIRPDFPVIANGGIANE